MSLSYDTVAVGGVTWNRITVTGTVTSAFTDVPEANRASPLRIVGATATAADNVWQDLQIHYSTPFGGSNNGRLHMENMRAATATSGSVDAYMIYSRGTIVTMDNVEISGYSGQDAQTGGGAMRIRGPTTVRWATRRPIRR